MKKITTLSEAGKKGARITNSLLTKEKRSKAAKKGWRDRKKMLKAGFR